MEKTENRRRWQSDMAAPHVTGAVLEVDGGIGNFTPELARNADSLIGIEPNEYCHQRLVEKTGACPMSRFIELPLNPSISSFPWSGILI